jgi:hypothetical protein
MSAYDTCSTEHGAPLPEPKAAMRPGNIEIAQALQPWLNRMMHIRWGRRIATPHYRRSHN